jgi:hypothetical protein
MAVGESTHPPTSEAAFTAPAAASDMRQKTMRKKYRTHFAYQIAHQR